MRGEAPPAGGGGGWAARAVGSSSGGAFPTSRRPSGDATSPFQIDGSISSWGDESELRATRKMRLSQVSPSPSARTRGGAGHGARKTPERARPQAPEAVAPTAPHTRADDGSGGADVVDHAFAGAASLSAAAASAAHLDLGGVSSSALSASISSTTNAAAAAETAAAPPRLPTGAASFISSPSVAPAPAPAAFSSPVHTNLAAAAAPLGAAAGSVVTGAYHHFGHDEQPQAGIFMSPGPHPWPFSPSSISTSIASPPASFAATAADAAPPPHHLPDVDHLLGSPAALPLQHGQEPQLFTLAARTHCPGCSNQLLAPWLPPEAAARVQCMLCSTDFFIGDLRFVTQGHLYLPTPEYLANIAAQAQAALASAIAAADAAAGLGPPPPPPPLLPPHAPVYVPYYANWGAAPDADIPGAHSGAGNVAPAATNDDGARADDNGGVDDSANAGSAFH